MPVPKIVLLLLLLCGSACFGQSIILKGKVADSTGTTLESATVYLSSVKDSVVVAYTLTDKSGNWEIKTGKLKEPALLKISYLGLAGHNESLGPETGSRDFGTVKLAEIPTEIGEVIIEAKYLPYG